MRQTAQTLGKIAQEKNSSPVAPNPARLPCGRADKIETNLHLLLTFTALPDFPPAMHLLPLKTECARSAVRANISGPFAAKFFF
jgi:hypothetical protein